MARKNKTDVRTNGAPFIDIGIPDKDREKIALGTIARARRYLRPVSEDT